ncbi:MAG: class I SAM-dependent methyltransferase [Promethearchaeota archaeon]
MTRYFDRINNRLVLIEKKASPDFWDRHWNIKSFRKTVQANKNNRFILNTTRRFLKKGRILEGGCGKGDKVYCLHYNGYSAFGVDFAENTVKRINHYFPELNVTLGDVRHLDFEDLFFDGYWSLGVIEHFYDGYEDILSEMQRVTKKGGYLFLTFPFLSPLRRLKVRFGSYKKFIEDNCDLKDFYQFIFNNEIVKHDFEKKGFKLRYMKPKGGLKGLKDEVLTLKPILQRLYDYNGKNRFIKYFRFLINKHLAFLTGHMILMIFEKT